MTQTAEMIAAIDESTRHNITVEITVPDVQAAYLDLLASEYDIDSEDRTGSDDRHGDRRVLRVWGWTGETPDGEADWTLTLVQAA